MPDLDDIYGINSKVIQDRDLAIKKAEIAEDNLRMKNNNFTRYRMGYSIPNLDVNQIENT